jgi:hypothetical protein
VAQSPSGARLRPATAVALSINKSGVSWELLAFAATRNAAHAPTPTELRIAAPSAQSSHFVTLDEIMAAIS